MTFDLLLATPKICHDFIAISYDVCANDFMFCDVTRCIRIRYFIDANCQWQAASNDSHTHSLDRINNKPTAN